VVEGTKLGGFDIVGAMLGAIDNVGALDGSMLTVGTELGTELDVCLFVLPLSDSVEVRTLSTKNAGIQFRNRSQCGRYAVIFASNSAKLFSAIRVLPSNFILVDSFHVDKFCLLWASGEHLPRPLLLRYARKVGGGTDITRE
jgi:hypothetical protein